MRLEYAYLSKFADLLADGTISVIGAGLSGLTHTSLPAFTNLSLVAFVALTPEDRETSHSIELNILNPSGQPVLEHAVLTLGAHPKIDGVFAGQDTVHACIFHTGTLILTEFGTYRFTLSWKSGPPAEVTFRIYQAAEEKKA